jgi:pyruvate dehydrogenase E1 component
MIAFVGDAELDEGNIYECLQEGWKHGLRNCWWIIDYNRQSLDGMVREGLSARIRAIFEAFGWEVITLKYGSSSAPPSPSPGGEALRAWIDACPNPLYSALTYQGGAAWRARLTDALGDQGPVSALLERRSDAELAALMENLGGHCLETIASAYAEAARDDRPKALLAYTIKGYGTPLAGHKDNHAGLMTPAQMTEFQTRMNVRPGHEWAPFEGLDADPAVLRAFLDAVPFAAQGPRRTRAARLAPVALTAPSEPVISTQMAFGKLMDQLAKSGAPLAERVLTTSPDVTVSTNLGPWVNRRGLFARADIPDTFRDERVPSAQKWRFSPRASISSSASPR